MASNCRVRESSGCAASTEKESSAPMYRVEQGRHPINAAIPEGFNREKACRALSSQSKRKRASAPAPFSCFQPPVAVSASDRNLLSSVEALL